MAETELSIVVRARDQLTATLRQMGTTVDELARKVAADFTQAGRATDSLVTGVRQSASATTDLGREVSSAVEQVRQLGRADTSHLEIAIRSTREEIERLRAGAAVELIPGGAALAAERLEQQVREAEQALASLKKTGSEIDIATRIAQTEQAFASLGQHASLGPLEAEITRAQAELARMRDEATRAGGAVSELDRKRMDRLAADIGAGTAKMAELRGATDQARQGASLLGSTFSTVAAGIKSALLPILPILTLAGAAFAAQRSVSEALALEDALSRINAEANLTATELDALRHGALETARALGLSESTAAPALLGAVTDGARDAAEGLDRFQAAARLAAARGEDVGKVTDALTSILNAYRGANLEAARASDVLFEVARAGKVEVEELAGSLDAVLPLASGLGVSFEELSAILVTATQKGGGFAQGMQAVRVVLAGLTDASPEARAALEGVDFSSARIKAQGLVPVLQDISERLHGNVDAIRAVFPDGRAFGAVLALLADQGAGLTAALEQLANSGGAVEQALGRRMRDPVFQLGVLFNNLRSNFAEAFGGAFLTGVQRAIAEMGGLENASREVANVARALGDTFGAALPAIGRLFGAAIDEVTALAESIGGVEPAILRFGLLVSGAGEAAVASLRVVRAEVGLVIDALGAIGKFQIRIGGDPEKELENIKRAIGETEGALQRLAEGREGHGGVELFNLENLQEAVNVAREQGAKGIPLEIKPDVEQLDDVLASLGRRKLELEAEIRGDTSFSKLGDNLADAWRKAQERIEPVDFNGAFSKMAEALDGEIEQIRRKLGALKPESVEVPVEVDLAAAEEHVALFEGQLAALRTAARETIDFGVGDPGTGLAILGPQAEAVRARLDDARKAAAGFRAELVRSLETQIGKKAAEIQELSAGLADARSQAELLGVAGEAAAEAMGPAFSADKVRALEDEIAQLQVRLNALRGTKPIEPVSHETVVHARRLRDELKATDVALATLGVRAGAFAVELDAINRAGRVDPFEDVLRLFRGGIEPSLEHQVQLIEEQVGRQRDATKTLREWLPLLQSMGALTADRIDLLDEETAKLAQSADLLKRRAALESAGLRRTALELGINPTLDEAELRQQIDEARDFLERQDIAIRLGVELDGKSLDDAQKAIVAARQELQERAGALELRQVERDAIHFGVAIDGRGIEQIKADIADAQDEAQAFADDLRGRGLNGEALALGISIDGKSPQQIEQDIQKLQADAQAFATAHPIEADLLRSGIEGGSRAIADFVTHAKSGKEALRDFFTSMAAQAVQAAAQLLIVKALLATFGAQSGVGSFLAAAFGAAKGHGFEPDGGVMAFRSGGAVSHGPGARAARMPSAAAFFALATGGAIPAGVLGTDLASAGGAPPHRPLGAPSTVHAYAQGGAPALLWHAPTAVERFAAGGSPWMERIVSRPTLERSERLAGSAIVPLSGGGVATTSGERLPVERRGSELVVVRHALGAALGANPAVEAFARGGAPWALFGEAGPESVMRMHRSDDGRPGIRAADGAVLPLTRVEGGRLGVEAHAAGQLFGRAERFALGGLHGLEYALGSREYAAARRPEAGSTRHWSLEYALGGIPAPSPALERDAVQAFARGGAPATRSNAEAEAQQGPDLGRALRTAVAPYAAGGAFDLSRALWTSPQAFEAGGAPDLHRTVHTDAAPYALGGAPALERELRTLVHPFAAGGAADLHRGLWTATRAHADGLPADISRTLRTSLGAYALGGAPRALSPVEAQAVASGSDVARVVRTTVAPYARGGAPEDLHRSVRTFVETFAGGGVPDVRRAIWADVRSHFPDGRPESVHAAALGGTWPAAVQEFAIGGQPSKRAPVAFPIGGDPPASAIRASTPMQPSANAAQANVTPAERGPVHVTISPNIELTVMALDPKTAAEVIMSQRKVVVAAFAEEFARSPAVRAMVRGDRG